MRYLLRRNMLMHLARAINQVVSLHICDSSLSFHFNSVSQPPSSKATTQAPVYISRLLTAPFLIFTAPPPNQPTLPSFSSFHGPGRDPNHTLAFSQFLTHVLAVPLLPNRIPLTELPHLVSRIPWADLPFVVTATSSSAVASSFSSILKDTVLRMERLSFPHVLANLLAFLPPRYAKLPAASLASYLELYTALLEGVHPEEIEPPQAKVTSSAGPSAIKQATEEEDSESDDDVVMDLDVPRPSRFIASSVKIPAAISPVQAEVVVRLDARTLSRLAILTSPTHISSLLVATSRHPETRERLFRCAPCVTLTDYAGSTDKFFSNSHRSVILSILKIPFHFDCHTF